MFGSRPREFEKTIPTLLKPFNERSGGIGRTCVLRSVDFVMLIDDNHHAVRHAGGGWLDRDLDSVSATRSTFSLHRHLPHTGFIQDGIPRLFRGEVVSNAVPRIDGVQLETIKAIETEGTDWSVFKYVKRGHDQVAEGLKLSWISRLQREPLIGRLDVEPLGLDDRNLCAHDLNF